MTTDFISFGYTKAAEEGITHYVPNYTEIEGLSDISNRSISEVSVRRKGIYFNYLNVKLFEGGRDDIIQSEFDRFVLARSITLRCLNPDFSLLHNIVLRVHDCTYRGFRVRSNMPKELSFDIKYQTV